MTVHRIAVGLVLNAAVLLAAPFAAVGAGPPQPEPEAAVPDPEELYRQFQQSLSGIKLVGRYTVLGKEDQPLAEEEYTISRVTKLPQGDYWLFNTRIRYGDKDVTVPLPLQVKWAGATPVITLTDLTIPGLGTFSSRVVIYKDKYAGTWSHGEVGGHLFGTIEKLPEQEKGKEKAPPQEPEDGDSSP